MLYQKGTIENGQLVIRESVEIPQLTFAQCPFTIFIPSHYRPGGGCLCTNAAHRKEMKKWGYTAKSFKGIPLID